MPMLVLLLLHAALSGVDAGATDAGSPLQSGPAQSGLAPVARMQAQVLLRQDSLLQWERGQDSGSGSGSGVHALRVSHKVDGRWQLRHRISFGAPATH
ncbi:TPA: hypothetical protein QDZ34_002765 [Stenotrophomonas maltophilia]|nr:hypothetical protein [Stenotrophomonas maltophilia]HDS1025372.1 hypothetical protein [Stenotrophomonas maltophilia]HDS1030535.1 hypothetical protein [Stenotrophomonas maltophilia]HDS1035402.1 hypothetical protein [Stenotrophomonas maltophilia]